MTKCNIDNIEVGDEVTFVGIVKKVDVDFIDVDFGDKDCGCFYMYKKHITSIKKRPIAVGDMVTWGEGYYAYQVICFHKDNAFLYRSENNTYRNIPIKILRRAYAVRDWA